MRSRATVVITMCVVMLYTSLVTADEQSTATAANTNAEQEASVRPTRQVVTTTTFAPAVVEFLKRPLPAQLVTLNPSGSPQLTIMWFQYEDGALLFTTTTDRVKFRNYQNDPRATFAVLDPTNMYKWVIVNGTLSVDDRDPQAFYRHLAEHYFDEAGLAEWRKRAVMERRTVLKLTPTQIRALGFAQE